jgi:HEAT repeat protein
MQPCHIAVVVLMACACARGEPSSAVDVQNQRQRLAALEQAIAIADSPSAKLAHCTDTLRDAPDADFRGKVLAIASKIAAPELEAFLIRTARTDPDAMIRGRAAAGLGQQGSKDCLGVLAELAASDKPTTFQVGCIQSTGTSRRQATFALAELACRVPDVAPRVAAILRDLKTPPEPDPERLADARIQALYQVTKDDSLIKPFLDRLRADDPEQRISGVVAFRFLKLRQAPHELVRLLDDPSPKVTSWVALVLGGIGNPAAVPPLMTVATDRKREAGTRCNAIFSLGRLKAAPAADLMTELHAEPNPTVSANAAIALYRICPLGDKAATTPFLRAPFVTCGPTAAPPEPKVSADLDDGDQADTLVTVPAASQPRGWYHDAAIPH